jgi:hypothetical protein
MNLPLSATDSALLLAVCWVLLTQTSASLFSAQARAATMSAPCIAEAIVARALPHKGIERCALRSAVFNPTQEQLP